MVTSVLDRSIEEILKARFGVDSPQVRLCQWAEIVALCERFRIMEMGVFGLDIPPINRVIDTSNLVERESLRC